MLRVLAENLAAMGVREVLLEGDSRSVLANYAGTSTDSERVRATGPGALKQEAAIVNNCGKCGLGATRTHAVYGDGSETADIVFVGEAPGYEEDRLGLPFVGRAGKLLDRLLEQVGLRRADVYICNVLKCRPPENRDPLPEEVAACRPFLDKQLALIKPRVICCLGLYAAQAILATKDSMARLRTTVHYVGDVAVVPTYHTAAALRFPAYKQQIYDDLCRARDIVYG
jgi:DNA polymerase